MVDPQSWSWLLSVVFPSRISFVFFLSNGEQDQQLFFSSVVWSNSLPPKLDVSARGKLEVGPRPPFYGPKLLSQLPYALKTPKEHSSHTDQTRHRARATGPRVRILAGADFPSDF